MILKDEYSELTRALGFKGDTFWGDTFVPHAEIVAKVKELMNKMYDPSGWYGS